MQNLDLNKLDHEQALKSINEYIIECQQKEAILMFVNQELKEFDNKKITKRLETKIQQKLNKFFNSDEFVVKLNNDELGLFGNKSLIIYKPRGKNQIPYHKKIKISLSNKIFIYEEYRQFFSKTNYSKLRQKIENLKDNLQDLEQKINRYNKAQEEYLEAFEDLQIFQEILFP